MTAHVEEKESIFKCLEGSKISFGAGCTCLAPNRYTISLLSIGITAPPDFCIFDPSKHLKILSFSSIHIFFTHITPHSLRRGLLSDSALYDKKEGKRQEGVVVKVLERGMPEIVGTYQLNRDFGFVISDNPKFSKDIFIPRKEAAGIKNGDKVIVVITDYGSGNKNPEGKIKENLGNIRTPGTDILAIVKSFGIPSEFPEKE